jgi:hypothetical protein
MLSRPGYSLPRPADERAPQEVHRTRQGKPALLEAAEPSNLHADEDESFGTLTFPSGKYELSLIQKTPGSSSFSGATGWSVFIFVSHANHSMGRFRWHAACIKLGPEEKKHGSLTYSLIAGFVVGPSLVWLAPRSMTAASSGRKIPVSSSSAPKG